MKPLKTCYLCFAIVATTFFSMSTQACTLTVTKWGTLHGTDCWLNDRSKFTVKRPNLRTSAWSAQRIANGADISVKIINDGSASTRGFVQALNGPDGSFEFTVTYEIRRLDGTPVEFYDLWTQQFSTQATRKIGVRAIEAHGEIGINAASFDLRDNDYNYDVCVLTRVDSNHSRSANGEVAESDEQDNDSAFVYRLYPDADGIEDTVPYTAGEPTGCQFSE